MGLSGVRLLLGFAALCALVGAAAGAHSLHYNLTVRCQGGFVRSRVFAQGRLDDQLFLNYDNERGSAVPWALWAETVLGPETWDTETQDLAKSGKNLKATLADINSLKEQKGGSHSLQETWGCEIREDNHTRGFWNFYYDGEPFLSYHPEMRSWTVPPSSAQALATEVKNSWDADSLQSKAHWAHVQGTVCGRLRRYLNSWIAFNETTVFPTVNVTCAEALEDTIIMTGTRLLLQSRWPVLLSMAVAVIFCGVLWYKRKRTTLTAEGSDTPAIMKKPRKRPMRPVVPEPSLHSPGEARVEQSAGF